MMMQSVLCAVLGVMATRADLDEKPDFDLTLTKAAAQRFDGDNLVVICDVVLDNRAGKDVKVRSNFGSAFDGLVVVVRDEKGKLLVTQPYSLHRAPYRDVIDCPLKPGENKHEVRFPIKLPADVKTIRV